MNLSPILKSRIAKQFSRAASTYNGAADVQLDIAFDAMSLVPERSQLSLDIGCGTGRISQQLAKKSQKVIGMDLAYGMLEYAKQQQSFGRSSIDWLQGDAESIPLADESIDLVFSSMALQWCTNQIQVMSELNRVMKSGAEAVLAIMCEGSFVELNRSWQQVDKQRHVNEFATVSSWKNTAENQGLLVGVSEKSFVTWHQNIRQLLASIKSIGANVVLPSETDVHPGNNVTSTSFKPLSRLTLQNIEVQYQKKYAENSQLPLTYQVCFLHCQKP